MRLQQLVLMQAKLRTWARRPLQVLVHVQRKSRQQLQVLVQVQPKSRQQLQVLAQVQPKSRQQLQVLAQVQLQVKSVKPAMGHGGDRRMRSSQQVEQLGV